MPDERHNKVSGFELVHGRTYLDHLSQTFVAEYQEIHGLRRRSIFKTRHFPVSSADTDLQDANFHVPVGLNGFFRNINKLDTAPIRKNADSLHLVLSPEFLSLSLSLISHSSIGPKVPAAKMIQNV